MVISLLAAVFQIEPPPPPPPAPVAIDVPPKSRIEPAIVEFTPGPVRCGDRLVQPVKVVRPLPAGSPGQQDAAPGAYRLRFRIAEDGRPLSIGNPQLTAVAFFASAEDLAPALAAWRFAPGAPRSECVVDFIATATPVTTATPEVLHRFVALPRIGYAGWREALDRLRVEAPECFGRNAPRVLLQGFPDFDALPAPQGSFSYTMVGFDIGANGRARGIRTLSSDGNAALDAAGRDAIARSRYAKTARRGCNFPFHRRNVEPMAPPPSPEPATLRSERARCEDTADWEAAPKLLFPEPFNRRGIEGWGIVQYDVAPWGAIGNVEVLASEPAATFGDQAKRVVMSGKRAPSPQGASGCVTTVRFKMP